MYPNLGSTASQRGESYHPVIRKIINGQLSFEDSGKRLASTVLLLLKDLSTFEYQSMQRYDRRVQLDFAAFQYLVCSISNFALKKIEVEWRNMNGREIEAPRKLYPSTLRTFANKIDGQPLESVVVSSYIAGAYLASIIFAVPTNPVNLYHGPLSTRGTGCKARP